MDIQDMCIFARVAAVQNLSAVGTELGLTQAAVLTRLFRARNKLREIYGLSRVEDVE